MSFQKLPAEMQDYIAQSINPLLEDILTHLISTKPERVANEICRYLIEKHPQDLDVQTEVKRLQDQNSELRNQLKANSECVRQILSTEHEEKPVYNEISSESSEESTENGDEVGELVRFDKPYAIQARRSVSAEVYGQWNQKKAYVPKVFTKTDEQKARIQSILQKSILFQSLDATEMEIIINAAEEVTCQKGEVLIEEGDDGDCMYIVETGSFECLLRRDGQKTSLKVCEENDFFGELALMYNSPRAATVESMDGGVLWKLDRETFNAIVKESAQRKRDRYEKFLLSVPLLNNLDYYQRQQLCDVLEAENFSKDEYVCEEGQPGDKFYILQDGEAVAVKDNKQVLNYIPGDYFGELALLRNAPRAASILCLSNCVVLSLRSKSFKRLLGSMADIFEKAVERYVD